MTEAAVSFAGNLTDDPEGRQWPRTKRSDDATAVYLVVS